MSKIFINSTLTTSQKYTIYDHDAAGKPVAVGDILVKGGTNIYIPHGVKPVAVQTEVTEEQLTQLLANPVFVAHRANGFIEVAQSKLKEGELANLNLADEAAPLSDEKIAEKSKAKQKPKKAE